MKRTARGIRLLALCACLFVGAQVAAAHAADTPQPARVTIGAYVTGLRDVNTRTRTFDADIWFWALTPKGAPDPIQTMEFTNAKVLKLTYPFKQTVGNQTWYQDKVSGTFFEAWDLRNYPFDKHVLTINVEEALLDTTGLTYRVDSQNSSLNSAIHLDGWKTTGFTMRARPVTHATTFGDPSLPPGSSSTYAGLALDVGVVRSDSMAFIQLIMPVYVAILSALLITMLSFTNDKLTSPRYSMLAGALFLIVINLRAVNDQIGSVDGLAFIQTIHVGALVTILLVTLFSALSQKHLERGVSEEQVARSNIITTASVAGAFVVFNLVVILTALY